ncbi:MAG: MerR family transcriptional regulator [Lachnospiraceae bacterium]|nr:MerR family transcriptional regulator [Lachnospiraceae bacterium]
MKFYSTNEICKLCGVSRKQLRYYEEQGILSTVPRQDENNYRYYTYEHIYEIVAAKGLKNIDMSLAKMKDVIYGKDIESIHQSLQEQLGAAQENLEISLDRYKQSVLVYSKLAEALSLLKLHRVLGEEERPETEIVNCEARDVISLPYAATFEDEEYYDVEYLARIQTLAQEVDTLSFDELIYMTYGHFDSEQCSFNGEIHDFKIAVPVLDQRKPCRHYDRIPAFRGVSIIHIGDPKEERLYQTYMKLLHWAHAQGYELENWSVEEWLISPMITNNKDLWVIRIMIPLKEK